MPPIPPPPQQPSGVSSSLAWKPRIVSYFQTYHNPEGQYISLLPLINNPSGITHVILAAIHINAEPGDIRLNDDPPDHAKYAQLWAEVAILQSHGVKVLGMLGGAARGTFARLDYSESRTDVPLARFETYYAPLREMLRKHDLDGVDLDVEEDMSLPGVVHLIDRLREDFPSTRTRTRTGTSPSTSIPSSSSSSAAAAAAAEGEEGEEGKRGQVADEFLITLAPVATALMPGHRRHLSGFDYGLLEAARGPAISWYNVQFYNGWGRVDTPAWYDEIMRSTSASNSNSSSSSSLWSPERVVLGMLTNPRHGGSGYVDVGQTAAVLGYLVERYPRFGGVMGWEYWQSLPRAEEPWVWAGCMQLSMGMKTLRDAAVMVAMRAALSSSGIRG